MAERKIAPIPAAFERGETYGRQQAQDEARKITDEMVERAARGLWMARGYEREQFDRLSEATKYSLRHQARAALLEAFGASCRGHLRDGLGA